MRSTSPDPITTEVIRGGIAWVCEEMGIALRNSAYSPNIKERMDHSCAIFSGSGKLIGQAEHIPVHLGSLPWGVRNFLKLIRKEDVKDGDVFLFNDPYISGTHLNDLTMVKPIFHRGKFFAWLSVKAHIVDVGGKNPGSISYDSKEIFEEGIVIPPVKIVEEGKLKGDILSLILSNTRTPEVARGDINAMIFSLTSGEKKIKGLISEYDEKVQSWEGVWTRIIQTTEIKLRKSITKLIPDGRAFSATDSLEFPNSKIKVSIKRKGGKLIFSFRGTSRESEFPINAVPGTTLSAVLFVVKSLFDPEGDINEGLMNVVHIDIPEGTLLSPEKPRAVSAGNLETAQRLVDTLFLAFSKVIPEKVPSAGQGTMNNIMLGGQYISEGKNKKKKYWAFYETIGGGSGARNGKDGVSGTHVNMTNTMNTPVEAMEKEYPVLFLIHEIRRGSGGQGRWKGGDGIIRGFIIKDGKAKITLLCERRKTSPWGIKGGKPGKRGKEKIILWEDKLKSAEEIIKSYRIVIKKDDVVLESNGKARTKLPKEIISHGKGSYELKKGDIFIIFTPGGGGYGRKGKK